MLAKHALYQLSYGPCNRGELSENVSPEAPGVTQSVVGPGGLEPPTSRLSGVCSNQLSYRPIDSAPPVWPRPLFRGRPGSRSRPDLIDRSDEGKRDEDGGVPHLFRCLRTHQKRPGPEDEVLLRRILRKEVIQPQVPLRLPCYDFTPVADPTVVACPLAVGATPSGRTNSHGVTGGVYKARERIHRGMLIRDY